ncbi:hypothetical protein ACOMHN_015514 [Nucella lapillus]
MLCQKSQEFSKEFSNNNKTERIPGANSAVSGLNTWKQQVSPEQLFYGEWS